MRHALQHFAKIRTSLERFQLPVHCEHLDSLADRQLIVFRTGCTKFMYYAFIPDQQGLFLLN